MYIYAYIHASCIKTLFLKIILINYYYYYYYYGYLIGLLEGGTLLRKASKLTVHRTQTRKHTRTPTARIA